MANPIVLIPAGVSELNPSPIPTDWILKGTPDTRNRELAKSADRTSTVFDWSCTAGEFVWHYAEDEVLVVVDGETFITDETGVEHRLGPGDMGFFPAGSSCRWRITGHVRKFAMVKTSLPKPLSFAMRLWRKLRRMVGASPISPLTRAA